MKKTLLSIPSLFLAFFLTTNGYAQTITTIAGDGTYGYTSDGIAATSSELNFPAGVAVDASGNVYIADASNNRIRKVSTTGIITTIAGTGSSGSSGDGGPATAAEINNPQGVAVDGAGNVYVAEGGGNRIRKISASGTMSTVAGNGSGGYSGDGIAATSAEIYYPEGVAVDGAGNIYIADALNQRVRLVNTSGIISTIAGNGTGGYSGDGIAATTAEIYYPYNVAVDGAGNIYIADDDNNRVRKVNTAGIISTIAGDGTGGYGGDGSAATAAELYNPWGVAVDGAGNVYIGDWNNNRVRKVTTSGIITTIAGDGTNGYSGDGGLATAAELSLPWGVAVDGAGNVYIADYTNNRVRKVTASCTLPVAGTITGSTSICAGSTTTLSDTATGGTWSSSNTSLATVDASGDVTGVNGGTTVISYIVTNSCGSATATDTVNVTGVSGGITDSSIISTYAGDGTGGYSGDGGAATSAELYEPWGIAIDKSGNVYVAEYGNSRVRKVTPAGIITTVAGTGTAGYSGDGGPATNAELANALAVAVDEAGNLYIADWDNQRIRKVDLSGTITTVAGDGSAGYSGDGGAATSAELDYPYGVAVDGSGNIFISDGESNHVRIVNSSGIINTYAGNGSTTYSGDGGPATSAGIDFPIGLAVDGSGNLFIGEYGSNHVRKINSSGIITTVAGDGAGGYSGDGGAATSAELYEPYGVAVDIYGDVFVADGANSRIREINTSGSISTVAGTGTAAYSGDGGPATAAEINTPLGVAFDASGNLYIVDWGNQRIRKVGATTGIVISASKDTICAGTSVTFTATTTGADTGVLYQWEKNGTDVGTDSASYTTSSLLNGDIITCKLTASSTCKADTAISNSITMTVNPLPATGSITGPDSLCVGSTVTLSDTATGGTWSSSDSSVASINSSGIVTGNAGGTTVITYTLANSCGSASATKTLTVNAPLDIITTIAGNGTGGFSGDGGPATAAEIDLPNGVAVDAAGNVYISDNLNYRIRKISPSGIITTVAGDGTAGFSGDGGPATAAELYNPNGIAVDGSGNIYIADFNNQRIRKVTSSGIITTVAGNGTAGFSGDGGPATAGELNSPGDVAVDGSGNIYISDTYNERIRMINSSGIISTFAGDGSTTFSGDGGPATAAGLWAPGGVAVDASGNVYIGDDNFCIRKVNTSGIISTIAGDETYGYGGDGGPATAAEMGYPTGLAVDGGGNVYIADYDNERIRKVSIGGIITTVAGDGTAGFSGDGGPATAAELFIPQYVTLDGSGNMYICDEDNERIRKVSVGATISIAASASSDTICSGASVTFTAITASAGAGSGYQWKKNGTDVGADSTSYTTNSLATGDTISCVLTTSSVCGSADTVTSNAVIMTVISLPAPVAITGAAAVCIGDSVTLSDTSKGGVWSSGSTSVATVSSSGVVKGLSAGTSVITYTVTNSCGSGSASSTVTVNSSVTAGTITGVATVLVGSAIALSDTVAGGAWSSSDTSIATINSSGSVTGVAPGSAVITYTVTTGCGTASVSFTVTVSGLPSPGIITGGTSVCAGSTLTLSDTAKGGVWSSSDTSVATIGSTGIVTGVSAGTTIITYTVTNSYGSAFAYDTITINPLPVAGTITGDTSVCVGSTTTLSDTASGGVWSSSAAGIASVDISGNVTAVSAGKAIITYTVTNICAAIGDSVTVNVSGIASDITGGNSVCKGSSLFLSDSVSGGTWSTSDASITTLGTFGKLEKVRGISQGTAVITYTLTNTCGTTYATDTVTVYINASPLTPEATVCDGSTILLSDTAVGGTWSTSDATVATVDSSGNVTGVSQGIAIITYTVINKCGTSSSSSTVTVDNKASAITGTDSVCVEGLTALSDSTSGGVWSSGSASIAIVDASGNVTGISAGTTKITYTVTNGCGISSAAIDITVNPAPPAPISASGSLSVCTGDSVILSTGTGAGYTYQWVNDVTTIPGATDFTYTINAAGSYYVIVTSSSGCSSISFADSVTIVSLPVAGITVAGDTVICPGGTTELDATAGVGYTYQWYNGGIAIPGATGITYVADTAGLYTVTVTSPAGCSSTSAEVSVTMSPIEAIIIPVGPTTFCAGGFVILNADTSTGLSYQWQLDSVSIAGAVSATFVATTAGNYTVIVTSSFGCTVVSAPVNVTVNPLPSDVVSAIGATTLCAGDSVVLSATSDPTYTYQWSNGAGIIPGATNANYTVIAVSSDNYTVAIVNSYGCSDTSAVTAITVNPLPGATISPSASTICTGSTAVLNAPTGAGYTYQWYSGTTVITPITGATASSYTASTSDNYIVVVTSSAGCSSTSAAATVIVVPNPVILTDDPKLFCWGSSALLYVSIGGVSVTSISYQWEKDGVYISGATNSSYSAYLSGSYLCVVTMPGVCGTTTTNSITLVQYPLPDPIITFSGSILSTQNYFVTYQWYEGSAAVVGATASSITPKGDGYYEVAVTDTNGCQSISDIYVLSELAVSNISNNPGSIKIYPNPTTEKVYIESPVKVRAVISSMDGRMILNVEDAKELDINNVASGVYMLMLYDESGRRVKVQKLVKSGD